MKTRVLIRYINVSKRDALRSSAYGEADSPRRGIALATHP